MNSDQFVTKKDVEDVIKDVTPGIVESTIRKVVPGIVTEIVTNVVEKSTHQILDAVGEQFDVIIDQLDDLATTTNRISDLHIATADKVAGHKTRIQTLEHKIA